jgi:hypothetical protein
VSPMRPFPFGHEPAVVRAPEEPRGKVTTEPPNRTTELSVDFAAPTTVLPFRAPPPVPPPAPMPARPPTRRRHALRPSIIVVLVVLVVMAQAALVFLVVRGHR